MSTREYYFLKFYIEWLESCDTIEPGVVKIIREDRVTVTHLKPSVISQFNVTFSYLRNFISQEFEDNDLDVANFDIDFINDFKQHLATQKKLALSTVEKHIQRVRKVLVEANKHYNVENLVTNYTIERSTNQLIYLTGEEIERLRGYNSAKQPWNKAKDFFLFVINTGLEYDELLTLSQRNIKDHYIVNIRKGAKIPLTEESSELINKFKEDGRESIFPLMTVQKMNDYLKEVAIGAEIDKKLTYSVARNTYIINLLQSKKLSSNLINLIGLNEIYVKQKYSKFIPKRSKQK